MWIRLPLVRLSGRMDFSVEDVAPDASIVYMVFGRRWIPVAIRSSDVGVVWDEESLEYDKRLDVWMLRPIRNDMMHSINVHMIECDGDLSNDKLSEAPPMMYAHCGVCNPPDNLTECMDIAAGAVRSGWAWRQAAPMMDMIVMRLLEELPRCCDWVIPWDVMRPGAPLDPDPCILSKFMTEVYYTDPESFQKDTGMVEFWVSAEGREVWSRTSSDTKRLITKNMLFYTPRIPSSRDASIRTILPSDRVPRIRNGQVFSVFNPCIFEVRGVRRVCIRTSNYDVHTYRSRDAGSPVMTRNFIVSMDHSVVEVVASYSQHNDAVVKGLEDMRFFSTVDESGRLMFLANCCDYEGTDGMPVVVWGAVDPETGHADVVHLDYGGRVEKNWMPIVISGKIMAVYSIDPLVILDIDGIHRREAPHYKPRTHIFSRTGLRSDGPLDGAPLRGSGALIIDNDGWYLGVVHQVLWTHRGQRKYYHRFIRIHPASGSVVVGLPWVIHGCRIEYVLSVLKDGNKGLTIAYSCMDEDARTMIVPYDSMFMPGLRNDTQNRHDPYEGWPEDTFWINRDCDAHRKRAFEGRFMGIAAATTLHRISAEDGDAPGFIRSWPACAFVGDVHTAGNDEHQNVRTLALTLSHAKALDAAYGSRGKGEWVLILEDDACLENVVHWPMSFGRMISAIPDDTNLVLMSPLFPLRDLDVSRAALFCPLKHYGTTLAYIIRRSAIPDTLRALTGRFPREPLGVSDLEIYRACPGRSLMTCIPWFTFPDDNTSTIHDQHARFQMECKRAFHERHFV